MNQQVSAVHDRLLKCFHAVFPDLDPDKIPDSSLENTSNWDSLASVSLIALIEDEFDASVPLDEYRNFNSFRKVQDYLERRVGE